MKIFKLSLVCFLYLVLCGYIFLQDQPDSYYFGQLDRAQKSIEETLPVTYAEVFKATINVLRDFNIFVVKKDFQGKVILGAYYLGDCLAIYGVFFEEGTGVNTKITLKATGSCFSDDYIFNKIKEEVQLQKIFR